MLAVASHSKQQCRDVLSLKDQRYGLCGLVRQGRTQSLPVGIAGTLFIVWRLLECYVLSLRTSMNKTDSVVISEMTAGRLRN